MSDADLSPYRDVSDDLLIARAKVHGAEQGAMVGKVIRRLKGAVDEQNRASTALAKRIEALNVWLLVVTVAIGAMTLVQAVAAWRSLMR